MRITATKRYTFEASHNLIDYDGKCAKLHGHSYKLEVSFAHSKGIDPKTHMVLDFNTIDDIVKPIVDRYDHEYLNEFFDNPTAEAMAQSMYEEINYALQTRFDVAEGTLSLTKLKLWETEKCHVTIEE